ncbi:MAG: cytochrome C oxidase subunit IV family protein [Rhodothermales bacterium]
MAHAHAGDHGHHIIPLKLLLSVFGGLVFLTIFTVFTAEFVDLGPFNIALAIMIAVMKAGLVVTFFMALKWDNRVNALIFAVGCIFVIVFLTFTLFDTAYRGDIGNVGKHTIEEEQRALEGGDAAAAGHEAPAPAH